MMADPYNEISLENIRDFMVKNGGRVTNHELVRRFKHFLTNTHNVEQDRYQFKKYVNTLSTISQEGGEKFLILKRKYRVGTPLEMASYPDPGHSPQSQFTSPGTMHVSSTQHSPGFTPPAYRAPPPYRPPPEPGVVPDSRTGMSPILNFSAHARPGSLPVAPAYEDPSKQYPGNDYVRRSSFQSPHELGIPPPPINRSMSSNSSLAGNEVGLPSPVRASNTHLQRPRSLATSSTSLNDASHRQLGSSDSLKETLSSSASRTSLTNAASMSSVSLSSLDDQLAPAIPPRKRTDNKENSQPVSDTIGKSTDPSSGSSSQRSSMASLEDNAKVSVRETTQKFNKMASESVLSGRSGAKSGRGSRLEREDDEVPLLSMFGPEGQEWAVAAAKSDFNEILRLLKIHPILAKHKDIANTALHWAAKHGRPEVIKLLHGTYQVEVNCKSNGGYTPLHLAAIYNRHETFDLLTHYGADLNIRDYSGKKPRQYQTTTASTISHDTQKRIIRRRSSLKESTGFLRIGSLNVRVKKTTDALNNLISRDVEARLHRSYGSSDSLPETEKDSKLMPPPKLLNLKRRKKDKKENTPTPKTTPRSTPSTTPAVTPTSARSESGFSHTMDSDSDSAYGFGNEWH